MSFYIAVARNESHGFPAGEGTTTATTADDRNPESLIYMHYTITFPMVLVYKVYIRSCRVSV